MWRELSIFNAASQVDRVPSGLPYSSIKAQMHQLEVVFLSRFLFEILRYISLLLALQPAKGDDAAQPLEGSEGETASTPASADEVRTL